MQAVGRSLLLCPPETGAWHLQRGAAWISVSDRDASGDRYQDPAGRDQRAGEMVSANVIPTRIPPGVINELAKMVSCGHFWMVYCASPEVRAALAFLDFPLTIAPYVWNSLNPKKED